MVFGNGCLLECFDRLVDKHSAGDLEASRVRVSAIEMQKPVRMERSRNVHVHFWKPNIRTSFLTVFVAAFASTRSATGELNDI